MTSILDRICLFVGVLLGCAISPTTGPSSDRSRDGREAVQLYSSPHTAPSAGGAVPHPALDSSEAAGRWRRAKRSDLERLMLWPSHLLIRHADVHEADSVSFTMADFHSVLPRPTRTRDEARALARTLVDRARERPARFAELARQYSEDIVRKDSGGSFGGIPAARLTPWPAVLDAVLALSPGDLVWVSHLHAASASRTADGDGAPHRHRARESTMARHARCECATIAPARSGAGTSGPGLRCSEGCPDSILGAGRAALRAARSHTGWRFRHLVESRTQPLPSRGGGTRSARAGRGRSAG
jgi:hypothetical protein